MKKKRICALILSAVLAAAFFVPARAAGGGIQAKLNDLLNVYDEATYFTSDGGPSGGSRTEKCSLENIPSRGGLPAGKEVTECDWQGWSYSCVAFGNYVYYYLFRCAFFNEKNTVYEDFDHLCIGDYIRFNGGSHTAIYLWEDEDYYYVYDANGDGGHSCMVSYNNAYRKAYWKVTAAYHAYNYDEVASSSDASLFALPAGFYSLRSARTGLWLSGPDLNVSTEDYEEFNLRFTPYGNGFTIAFDNDPTRLLTRSVAADCLTFSDGSFGGAVWYCERSNGGMIIRNSSDDEYCLACVDGALTVRKRTGEACEMWRLGHKDHSYVETIITQPGCVSYGAKTLSCVCGDVTVIDIPPLGHRLQTIKTVAATNAVCGYTKKQCSVCGEIVRENVTGKLYPYYSVRTPTVRETADAIVLMPGVVAETVMDLFPDMSFYGEANMTGAFGRSSFYDKGLRVVVAGDADCDGEVGVTDARYVLRASIGLERPSAAATAAGDWDGDGALSINDARMELRCAIGLENITSLFEMIG